MKLIYILKCSLLYVGDGLTVGFLNRFAFGKSLFLEPFGVGFQDRIRILMYLLPCMYPVCILIFQSVSHQDDTSRYIKIHQDTSRLYISDQDTTRIHAHVVDVRVHTALAHVGFSTYRGIGNILPFKPCRWNPRRRKLSTVYPLSCYPPYNADTRYIDAG